MKRWAMGAGRRGPGLLVFAFAAATLGGDCDRDVASDPTFRDWCGASLCAWTLKPGGAIHPAPTWNVNDLGVSFDVTPTEITQTTTESSAKCLLFTSVADIDPSAQMTLAVDFDSDGSFEYSAPLAAVSWQRVQTEITAPAAYQGITFRVRKDGTGTAILAEMRIQATSDCTAPPVTIEGGAPGLGDLDGWFGAGDAESCTERGARGGACR